MKELKKKQVQMIDVSDILPYDGSHNTESAVNFIAKSLEQYGFQQPIVIDGNNTIVAGNALYKAACQIGLSKVPCITVSELSEDEVKQYRIADNKTSEFARWNQDKLKKELSFLDDISTLQFCFDENLLSYITAAPLAQLSNKDVNKTSVDVKKGEEKADASFKDSLSSIDKGMAVKPVEYIEHICSKCGKKIIIKK